MKVLSVSLQNFGSYNSLEFDFANQGLTLIQGPTGSGKSTLCDVTPWCIWGVTAKGGPVSDVLTWPGTEVTIGSITLEAMGSKITIVRSRGPKAKDNDLYWIEEADPVIRRGKDLLDSQKLINGLLGGITLDLYLAGAYYHEFSQTAQFFTTTAKGRRALCEQLVDLSLPIKLTDGISKKRKTHSESLRDLTNTIQQLKSNQDLLIRLQDSEKFKSINWKENHEYNKTKAGEDYERFESKRHRIINNKCNSCGTVLSEPRRGNDDSTNPYLERLKALETAVNPHTGALKDYSAEIATKKSEISYLEGECLGLNILLGDLDALQQVTEDFRSSTIQNSIKFIESSTNKLLTDFFDAEIQVTFETAAADKLDVTIFKDGNTCSYTQLSKGQRCLLKLCFGTAVMEAVQNYHGISFAQVFYDEALDGLSDEFKIKAYRLFETKTQIYNSVYLVEHNEALKSMLTNSYSVSLVNGKSEIAKAI